MEPILTYSEITGRVYIVTKYKRLDGGVIDAREKFDVTEWAESYAKMLNSQTVKENVKLRELVRVMHSELVSCEDNGYVCGGHKFDYRVRELGIEVES